MQRLAIMVDSASIERATWLAQRRAERIIEQGKALETDPDRPARLAEQFCPICYYTKGNRVAGAAMTEQPCGICHKAQMYGSTNTDVLCLPCAQKEQLCKHCGGDIDSVTRATLTGISKTLNVKRLCP